MSNLIINWRFGSRHLQVVRWSDWAGYIRARRSPVTFFANDWHRGPGSTRYPESLGGAQDPAWRWMEFYEGSGYLLVLAAILIGAVLWTV